MQETAKRHRKSRYSESQPLLFYYYFFSWHCISLQIIDIISVWLFIAAFVVPTSLNFFLTCYCLLSYLRTLSLSSLLRYVQDLYAFYKTVNKDRKLKPGPSEVSGNTSEFPAFSQKKKKCFIKGSWREIQNSM